MNDGAISPDDFATFFRDVHDVEPFPWQMRLTNLVLRNGKWPKVIDLPTGTGKTATLDTAVFSLAARPREFPRRIVFVIDRRIVVDQVFERAQQICSRLRAANTPILRRVRDSLAELSDGDPLGVAALRGGIPMDGEWARRPDQPWVMVSTVDQFGSQLFFRGYGVNGRQRPINAGLAGNDCLVILDEVHLSTPFAQTLGQVAELHTGNLPRRFSIIEMSATPSDVDAERFELEDGDLEASTELRRRVKAKKSATLVPVANQNAIPSRVAKILKEFVTGPKSSGLVRSVGVVVNRVRTARETYDELKRAGYDTHLLTGRMRPLDKIDALDRIMPAVAPEGNYHSNGLVIVVATQAIEVGADFNFDAMITECAPIDSLRQRFGRLDRRGTLSDRTGEDADAWIIGPKSVVGSKMPDPIYGPAVSATWKELESLAAEGPVDIGTQALRDFPENTFAPRSDAPMLLESHLDAWFQTDPEPIVQPRLDWFLHGVNQDRAAEVSVLWRRDRSPAALRLVPPRQAEVLKVPIGAAKSWLAGANEVEIADAGASENERTTQLEGKPGNWVRWVGFDKNPEEGIGINDIRPGDILIVDPVRGGLHAGSWAPGSDDKVEDLGDFAQLVYNRKATLRLDLGVYPGIPNPSMPNDETEADAPAYERVKQWFIELGTTDSGGPNRRITDIVDKLGGDFAIEPVHLDSENSSYYILIECHAGKPKVDSNLMDGSDEAGSLIGSERTLEHHLVGVAEKAKRFAERLGLEEFATDLSLAGRLHDIGKVDRRFQRWLVGGDPIKLAMLSEPLAKSLPGVRGGRGGYPSGMRHEVSSVALINSNPEVLGLARDPDLVLHLIGTHHGVGRPLPLIAEDSNPEKLRYSYEGQVLNASSSQVEGSLALEMADRFWRLKERYGYYGLAWLEAIFRLADHRQSEEEAN